MLPWRLLRRLNFIERNHGVRLEQAEHHVDVLSAGLHSSAERLDRVEEHLRTLQETIERLSSERLATAEQRLDGFGQGLAETNDEVAGIRDTVLPAQAERSDQIEKSVADVGCEVERVRDNLVPDLQVRSGRVESSLGRTDSEVARLRDGLVPAAVRRSDALLERLSFELAETSSLVERMMQREPLPMPKATAFEAQLADDLARVQPLLVEAFRGSEHEVAGRLADDVSAMSEYPPVLDLGCGRGELLLALREHGVESEGVESDPALVGGARRRGLKVTEADALETLKATDDESFGCVTAYHFLEHLPLPSLLDLANEVHRVLRPGGLFCVECPNPHSLRVGGDLFWLDPTHLRPLLPETLSLFLHSVGFSVRPAVFRHPFEDQESFAVSDDSMSDDGPLAARLSRLELRLDELLNGARDYYIVAERAGRDSSVVSS